MKLVHYRKNCIGCNSCVEHSKLWSISENDGKADLAGAKEKNGVWVREIDYSELDESKNAQRDCPVNIIKVEGI